MSAPLNKVATQFATLARFPLGKFLFSKIICFTAPYFSTIKPRFVDLKPGFCQIKIKNRRAVHNHIGTVHAIAMCNMAELAGGMLMEASISKEMRWIPVGMTVKYQKMAKTDLVATCRYDDYNWTTAQDVVLPVSVTDTSNNEVFRADITMKVSVKKK